MTEEQALETCKMAIRYIGNLHSEFGSEEFAEFIKTRYDIQVMAKAIEKQIHHKPNFKTHDHEEYFSREVICGYCGECIGEYDFGASWSDDGERFRKKHRYCSVCGQAIDWS